MAGNSSLFRQPDPVFSRDRPGLQDRSITEKDCDIWRRTFLDTINSSDCSAELLRGSKMGHLINSCRTTRWAEMSRSVSFVSDESLAITTADGS